MVVQSRVATPETAAEERVAQTSKGFLSLAVRYVAQDSKNHEANIALCRNGCRNIGNRSKPCAMITVQAVP
jgi:hypothetical protein